VTLLLFNQACICGNRPKMVPAIQIDFLFLFLFGGLFLAFEGELMCVGDMIIGMITWYTLSHGTYIVRVNCKLAQQQLLDNTTARIHEPFHLFYNLFAIIRADIVIRVKLLIYQASVSRKI
jgi:hypothetical protein